MQTGSQLACKVSRTQEALPIIRARRIPSPRGSSPTRKVEQPLGGHCPPAPLPPEGHVGLHHKRAPPQPPAGQEPMGLVSFDGHSPWTAATPSYNAACIAPAWLLCGEGGASERFMASLPFCDLAALVEGCLLPAQQLGLGVLSSMALTLRAPNLRLALPTCLAAPPLPHRTSNGGCVSRMVLGRKVGCSRTST